MFRFGSKSGTRGSSSRKKKPDTASSSSSRRRGESVASGSTARRYKDETRDRSRSGVDVESNRSYATASDRRAPRSLTENAIRSLSGYDDDWEDLDARGERRDRESSLEGTKKRDKQRERSASLGQVSEKDKGGNVDRSSDKLRSKQAERSFSSGRFEDAPKQGSRGHDSVGTQVASSGSSQLPGQYEQPRYPYRSSAPVQGQLLCQSSYDYSGPTQHTTYGKVADYYDDQGQSMAQQPEVSPESATINQGAQQYPNLPEETGHGTAAEYYAPADLQTGMYSNPSKPLPFSVSSSRPSKSSKSSKASASSSGASGKPSKTGMITDLPVFESNAGAGTAIGYTTAGGSNQAQGVQFGGGSSHGTVPTYSLGDRRNSLSHATSPSTTPNRQSLQNEYYYAPPPPDRPSGLGKQPMSSNASFYTAAAAAAGLGAGAYAMHEHDLHAQHQSYQGHTQSASVAATPMYYGASSQTPASNAHLTMQHKHKGPISKFIDWWKDYEDVRKMEEYTEYIGVCKYCFDPRSSAADAPRKHHYYRRRSNESIGRRSSESLRRTHSQTSKYSKIDKDSRYHSSDNERQRKRSSWLGTGMVGAAGYGLTRLWESNRNFDDTYSVRSGRRSELSRQSSHRGSVERGVVYGDKRREGLSSDRMAEGNISKERARSRTSDSRSRDRKSNMLGTAALAGLSGSTARLSRTDRSADRSSKGKLVRRHTGSRDPSPRGAFDRRRSRGRSESRSPGLGEILGITGSRSQSRVRPSVRTSRSSRGSDREKPAGVFGGIFAAQPKLQRREHRKKSKGFFAFNNHSSSSSNSDLAFGHIAPRPHRSSKRSSRKTSKERLNATLLGIGATAAAIAAAKGGKQLPRKTLRDVDRSKSAPSRQKSHDESSEDNGWESASEYDDSDSGESGLAFGDFELASKVSRRRSSHDSMTSQSSGTNKWSWRWGSKKQKPVTHPDHPLRSDMQKWAVPVEKSSAGVSSGRAPSRGESSASGVSSPSSMPPMRYVHPVSTNDPTAYEAAGSMIPGSYPQRSHSTSSRSNPAPIQHPQPLSSLQSDLFSTGVKAGPSEISHSGSSMSQSRPDVLRHTQTDPIITNFARDAILVGGAAAVTAGILANGKNKSPKEESSAGVRFELTEKQAKKDMRERREEQLRDDEKNREDENRAIREEAARHVAETQLREQREEADRHRLAEEFRRAEDQRRDEREAAEAKAWMQSRLEIEAKQRELEYRRREMAVAEAALFEDEQRRADEFDRQRREEFERGMRTQKQRIISERDHEDLVGYRGYEEKSYRDDWSQPASAGLVGAVVGAEQAFRDHGDDLESVSGSAHRSTSGYPYVTSSALPIDSHVYESDRAERDYDLRDHSKENDTASGPIDRVPLGPEDRERRSAISQASFFRSAELPYRPKGKEAIAIATRDDDGSDYRVTKLGPDHSNDDSLPSYHSSAGMDATDTRNVKNATWTVPTLNFIAPTPPISVAGSAREDRSPVTSTFRAEDQSQEQEEQDVISAEGDEYDGISWGHDHPRQYEVRIPEYETYEPSTRNQDDSRDYFQEESSHAYPSRRSVNADPDDGPSETIHEGYRAPYYQSVTDLAFAPSPPRSQAALPGHGFVEGEVDEPTPLTEEMPHVPGGFDDYDEQTQLADFDAREENYMPLSSKEQKKRSKAAIEMSTESNAGVAVDPVSQYSSSVKSEAVPEVDDYLLSKKEKKTRDKAAKRDLAFAETVSSVEEIENKSQDPAALDAEDESWLTPKEKKKREKAAKRSEQDRTSSAVTERPITNEPSQEFEMPLSKKEKKKRDRLAKRGVLDDIDTSSAFTEPGPVEYTHEENMNVAARAHSDFDFPLTAKEKKKLAKAGRKSALHDDFVPALAAEGLEGDPPDTPSSAMSAIEGQNASRSGTVYDDQDDWSNVKVKKSKTASAQFNSPSAASPLRSEIVWDDRPNRESARTALGDEWDETSDTAQELRERSQSRSRAMSQSAELPKRARFSPPVTERDARSAESSPIERYEDDKTDTRRRSRHDDEGEHGSSSRSRSVAVSEPIEVYKDSKKHKRRSTRDSGDFDDSRSIASARSSRSARDADDNVITTSKKEKKGGLFGLLRLKSTDSTSKTKEKKEDDERADERRNRKHHRRRSSERSSLDLQRRSASRSRHRDEARHSSTSRHHSRYRETVDVDDSQSQTSESHRRRKHKHRDGSDEEGRTYAAEDNPEETLSPTSESRQRPRHQYGDLEGPLDHDIPGISSREIEELDHKERDQSFLEQRVEAEELPPLPASAPPSPTGIPRSAEPIHNFSLPHFTIIEHPEATLPDFSISPENVLRAENSRSATSQTNRLDMGPKTFSTDRPASPPATENAAELVSPPDSLPPSPILSVSTPRRPLVPLRPASSTSIPLRFRRPPTSPLEQRERSSSFSYPVTHLPETPIVSRTRQNRPHSSEFKHSTEYRPLYLVERNSRLQHTDGEEILPSLPSTRTGSRSSSLQGSEAYESAFEDIPLSRDEESGFDWSEAHRDDVLDSQQTTPRASIFPSDVFDVRTRGEPEFYSWSDVEREGRMHERVGQEKSELLGDNHEGLASALNAALVAMPTGVDDQQDPIAVQDVLAEEELPHEAVPTPSGDLLHSRGPTHGQDLPSNEDQTRSQDLHYNEGPLPGPRPTVKNDHMASDMWGVEIDHLHPITPVEQRPSADNDESDSMLPSEVLSRIPYSAQSEDLLAEKDPPINNDPMASDIWGDESEQIEKPLSPNEERLAASHEPDDTIPSTVLTRTPSIKKSKKGKKVKGLKLGTASTSEPVIEASAEEIAGRKIRDTELMVEGWFDSDPVLNVSYGQSEDLAGLDNAPETQSPEVQDGNSGVDKDDHEAPITQPVAQTDVNANAMRGIPDAESAEAIPEQAIPSVLFSRKKSKKDKKKQKKSPSSLQQDSVTDPRSGTQNDGDNAGACSVNNEKDVVFTPEIHAADIPLPIEEGVAVYDEISSETHSGEGALTETLHTSPEGPGGSTGPTEDPFGHLGESLLTQEEHVHPEDPDHCQTTFEVEEKFDATSHLSGEAKVHDAGVLDPVDPETLQEEMASIQIVAASLPLPDEDFDAVADEGIPELEESPQHLVVDSLPETRAQATPPENPGRESQDVLLLDAQDGPAEKVFESLLPMQQDELRDLREHGTPQRERESGGQEDLLHDSHSGSAERFSETSTAPEPHVLAPVNGPEASENEFTSPETMTTTEVKPASSQEDVLSLSTRKTSKKAKKSKRALGLIAPTSPGLGEAVVHPVEESASGTEHSHLTSRKIGDPQSGSFGTAGNEAFSAATAMTDVLIKEKPTGAVVADIDEPQTGQGHIPKSLFSTEESDMGPEEEPSVDALVDPLRVQEDHRDDELLAEGLPPHMPTLADSVSKEQNDPIRMESLLDKSRSPPPPTEAASTDFAVVIEDMPVQRKLSKKDKKKQKVNLFADLSASEIQEKLGLQDDDHSPEPVMAPQLESETSHISMTEDREPEPFVPVKLSKKDKKKARNSTGWEELTASQIQEKLDSSAVDHPPEPVMAPELELETTSHDLIAEGQPEPVKLSKKNKKKAKKAKTWENLSASEIQEKLDLSAVDHSQESAVPSGLKRDNNSHALVSDQKDSAPTEPAKKDKKLETFAGLSASEIQERLDLRADDYSREPATAPASKLETTSYDLEAGEREPEPAVSVKLSKKDRKKGKKAKAWEEWPVEQEQAMALEDKTVDSEKDVISMNEQNQGEPSKDAVIALETLPEAAPDGLSREVEYSGAAPAQDDSMNVATTSKSLQNAEAEPAKLNKVSKRDKKKGKKAKAWEEWAPEPSATFSPPEDADVTQLPAAQHSPEHEPEPEWSLPRKLSKKDKKKAKRAQSHATFDETFLAATQEELQEHTATEDISPLDPTLIMADESIVHQSGKMHEDSTAENVAPSDRTVTNAYQDIDFAATLAAGLQDSGFDPAIVIDEPGYHRRASPPQLAEVDPEEASFQSVASTTDMNEQLRATSYDRYKGNFPDKASSWDAESKETTIPEDDYFSAALTAGLAASGFASDVLSDHPLDFDAPNDEEGQVSFAVSRRNREGRHSSTGGSVEVQRGATDDMAATMSSEAKSATASPDLSGTAITARSAGPATIYSSGDSAALKQSESVTRRRVLEPQAPDKSAEPGITNSSLSLAHLQEPLTMPETTRLHEQSYQGDVDRAHSAQAVYSDTGSPADTRSNSFDNTRRHYGENDPLQVSIEISPDCETPMSRDISDSQSRQRYPSQSQNQSEEAEVQSEVDSTTKDRTSYLFQTPSDAGRDARVQSKGSSESISHRRQTPSPLDAKGLKPKTPLSLIIPGIPQQDTTPYVPLESPILKKHRSITDIGSPEHGVKVARRREVPLQGEREDPFTFPEIQRPSSSTSQASGSGARSFWRALDEKQSDRNLRSKRGIDDLRSVSGHSDISVKSAGPLPKTSTEEFRPTSSLSDRSRTSILRRRERSESGDLRAASRRGETPGPTTIAFEPPLTPPLQEDDQDTRFNGLGSTRTTDMADVYAGWGDVRGQSSYSPTRPPSVRKRQSMHIVDLEAQLNRLQAENEQLQNAKAEVEFMHRDAPVQHDSAAQSLLKETLQAHDAEITEKNGQIQELQARLEPLRQEVAQLTESNRDLLERMRVVSENKENRIAILQAEHSHALQQHEQSSKELDDLRLQHAQLSEGMEDILRQQVAKSVVDKNLEISRLNEDLLLATGQIKSLQAQILDSKPDDWLSYRDEAYFDTACQKLCQHVQQWILRFSKYSDNRMCRLTSDINDEKIEARLDNAILDGTDVDKLLADRVRRRDIFMSMVMSMIWEYVFTRYLFGMDREQRQKLKALERILTDVGPQRAVAQWRATTLTLLSRRPAFATQRNLDTEAVAQEILSTLSTLLPPPVNLETQILASLRNVLRLAVDLSIEMRTQRAEYIMLPPLQPEWDPHGDLVRKVHFNAALMNERSGDYGSNEELQQLEAVVKIVLFPLVVKKGNDAGEGEDEIVVCPAQVLVAGAREGKKVVRVLSGVMDIDEEIGGRNRSRQSFVSAVDSSAF